MVWCGVVWCGVVREITLCTDTAHASIRGICVRLATILREGEKERKRGEKERRRGEEDYDQGGSDRKNNFRVCELTNNILKSKNIDGADDLVCGRDENGAVPLSEPDVPDLLFETHFDTHPLIP